MYKIDFWRAIFFPTDSNLHNDKLLNKQIYDYAKGDIFNLTKHD